MRVNALQLGIKTTVNRYYVVNDLCAIVVWTPQPFYNTVPYESVSLDQVMKFQSVVVHDTEEKSKRPWTDIWEFIKFTESRNVFFLPIRVTC